MREDAPSNSGPWRTALLIGVLFVLIVVLSGGAWWMGHSLFSPGGAATLPGDLQEVQTSGGTYVGRITADDGAYVTLADPAIVLVETVPGGSATQAVVRSLHAEPYGLGDEIRISSAQIVFVGSVATDSQLAAAYLQAQGG